MTKQPKIADFTSDPNTGLLRGVIDDDIDIFYLNTSPELEKPTLMRVAIAVNQDKVNWGDILSYDYPKAMADHIDKPTGFYVIDPVRDDAIFIPGSFNEDLMPFLLEARKVKPEGWVDKDSLALDRPMQPMRLSVEGFG